MRVKRMKNQAEKNRTGTQKKNEELFMPRLKL